MSYTKTFDIAGLRAVAIGRSSDAATRKELAERLQDL
jgi:hypothetical protein